MGSLKRGTAPASVQRWPTGAALRRCSTMRWCWQAIAILSGGQTRALKRPPWLRQCRQMVAADQVHQCERPTAG
jgi:hypothetical protein